MAVHNHGPDDPANPFCGESMVGGKLTGECLKTESRASGLRDVLTEAQRDEIAKAISAHRLWNGRCEACGETSRHESRHMADAAVEVLASLPGVAVIQLPDEMTDRTNVAEKIRRQPMWEHQGSWATVEGDEVEFEADNQMVCGIIRVNSVPGLVSVLAAAAAVAEGEDK
ncbi:hypothetical protein I5H21_gp078 [Mycobacterium phage Byougenkin]|uniref:Uncharacterized protein n=1 Tax=Mycobacterium phage Byougenkin TaxID=2182394 RepID=A0A2U8UNF5_9CAUD|nr:hypothetical protein I5H21_gp078 [Mycobacterium phage Byougenkin]AWN05001.1 hypothetical protein SEA_BYOUGENKIN_78 [Mycobacterium phage Byougenkin]